MSSPDIARATMENRLMVATSIPASGGAVDLSEENVHIDFYGNEVSAAVARYKIDPSGVIYEEHSPQTEVPRLASPKS